jgi:hypothetical protein
MGRLGAGAAAALVAALTLGDSTAVANQTAVTVRAAPARVTAGSAVFVAAGVRPAGGLCRARIARGAVGVSLQAKRAVRGSVTWRWVVPRTAGGGTWVARVTCTGAGSGTARFTVVAQPPPPPPTIPAKVGVVKSGIASRLSSIGSTFAGYGIVLQNVSPDEDALDVQVTVNILGANGAILKSESDRYEAIPAGVTYYAGGESIFNGTPSRLEITVQIGKRQKKSIPGLPIVSNVRVQDSFFGAEVLGEITNPYAQTLSSLARITFVCLDSAGNVIGGGYGYPPAAVPPGGRIGFDESVEGLSAAQIASAQVSVEPEVQ